MMQNKLSRALGIGVLTLPLLVGCGRTSQTPGLSLEGIAKNERGTVVGNVQNSYVDGIVINLGNPSINLSRRNIKTYGFDVVGDDGRTYPLVLYEGSKSLESLSQSIKDGVPVRVKITSVTRSVTGRIIYHYVSSDNVEVLER